jgi:hypothetical protein
VGERMGHRKVRGPDKNLIDSAAGQFFSLFSSAR